MKSKEEIEQLAKEYSAIGKEAGLTHMEYTLEKIGYTNGYTQCQEDMQKDVEYWQGEFDHWYQQAMDMSEYVANKKYTEEQLLDAMSFAECYIIEHDKPLFLKSNGKPVPDCLEYIKSLNKQD